jgi:hypothetical protein
MIVRLALWDDKLLQDDRIYKIYRNHQVNSENLNPVRLTPKHQSSDVLLVAVDNAFQISGSVAHA